MSKYVASILVLALLSSACAIGCAGAPDGTDGVDGVDEGAGTSADEVTTSYSRQNVYNWARSHGAHAPRDLLYASLTKQKLVNALGWLYGNNAPRFYISAINSDHPTKDGPHGHNGGYCADLYATSNGEMKALLLKINSDPSVTQVGLGGAYKNYASIVKKPHFMDNNSTHVHISVY